MTDKKYVFIVSDATGLTAEKVIKAVLLQFNYDNVEIRRESRVRNKTRLLKVIRGVSEEGGLIIHTLVSKAMRSLLISECAKLGISAIDLIGQTMDALTDYLDTNPLISPGLQHELSESYFQGIECIEYTINHDDGRDPSGLQQADIIILGVSRTSKTPLSIFLSNQYSLCVANIPIIRGLDLPTQLNNIDPDRIIGLTISPKRLSEIRKARIPWADENSLSSYGDYNQIVMELEYSKKIFSSKGWSVIDITEKSIEEAASEIIDLLNRIIRVR